MYKNNKAIILMGVSGSGKTTIGQLLSEATQIPFFDGDDYHSQQNIEKMKSGTPLNDDDRKGWLEQLNTLIKEQLEKEGCIVACSALKHAYRNILSKDVESNVEFVYLQGTYEEIEARHAARKNHFIPTSLLQSQFETLEIPQNAYTISIMQSPVAIVQNIQTAILDKSAIGIIGLGVMGKSLCRNFASKGFKISMYNRHVAGKEENIAIQFKNEYKILSNAQAFDDLKQFVASLESPKKVLLMIQAGDATNETITALKALLTRDDIIIDGGNSFYKDTVARNNELLQKGIHFIGCGISGGEEGALNGPSLMPGGHHAAYTAIENVLTAIAAKDAKGLPCCSYIGKEGSGHYVKMIHNGIEYAEMQLLAEVYQIGLAAGKTQNELATILESWKPQHVDSYLLDITINILKEKEQQDWILEKIVDKADSKGTGNWATIEIIQEGVPATLIANALFARHLSSYKMLRTTMSKIYANEKSQQKIEINFNTLRAAYALARIINHYQGIWLIEEKSKKYNWGINLSEVARIWTNGCIIRSSLMQELGSVLKENSNILAHQSMIQQVNTCKPALANIVATSIQHGIAVPCLSEAINFLNGMSTEKSGANLIQAQRDYFGAHTFQRYDAPDGEYFHHDWTS